MKRIHLAGQLSLIFVLLGLCVNVGRADLIDFDSLSAGDVVTTQFPQATFSAAPAGQENRVSAGFTFPAPATPPNFIGTATTGGAFNFLETTIVDFTLPVNNLTFVGLGDEDSGVGATVDVFDINGFAGTVDVVTDGDFDTPIPVDVGSTFSNVTRIEIGNITDRFGLGWDTFEFEVVPEPSAIILLAVGAFFVARRRVR